MIQIESGEGRLCGNPNMAVQLIVDSTSKDLIPAEVNTMWAFDVGQELFDILNDQGSSDYKVVYKVVSQIYGYMSINHCKYGILCTYDKFYFLKREGSQPRSTPLISKMVHRCSDGPITVIKDLSALILAACDDHFYSSPYSTPYPGAFPYLVGSPQLADRQTKPTVTKPNPEALGAVFKGEHQASGMPLRVGAYLHEQPVQRAKGEPPVKVSPTRSQSSTGKRTVVPADRLIDQGYLPPRLWTMQYIIT